MLKIKKVWIAVLAIVFTVAGVYAKFSKRFSKKTSGKLQAISFGAALVSGVLFIDRNLTPVIEKVEDDEDLEMIDTDID